MSYEPRPIVTSGVSLPCGFQELIERLAENMHDVWAHQRLGEGWTYGPYRDGSSKKHPGLVPFHELPDSERDFDRAAALELVKCIMAMGYSIQKP